VGIITIKLRLRKDMGGAREKSPKIRETKKRAGVARIRNRYFLFRGSESS